MHNLSNCSLSSRIIMIVFVYVIFQDWWNSTTFSNYYRTWNVVVHDWLYTYIYKDVWKVKAVNFCFMKEAPIGRPLIKDACDQLFTHSGFDQVLLTLSF